MNQLLMALGRGADYSAASFVPTAGSAPARAALASPFTVLCLYGPAASGKTHLLRGWAEQHGAVYAAGDCPGFEAGGKLAVDQLEGLGNAAQERLFHALNLVADMSGGGGQIVLASTRPVRALAMLADVQSRLLLAPQIEIEPPTDNELKQLLLKWAADEQVQLAPAVLDYVFTRADRSAATLAGLMARLNQLSLEQKRAITVPLVRSVLQDGEDTYA